MWFKKTETVVREKPRRIAMMRFSTGIPWPISEETAKQIPPIKQSPGEYLRKNGFKRMRFPSEGKTPCQKSPIDSTKPPIMSHS